RAQPQHWDAAPLCDLLTRFLPAIKGTQFRDQALEIGLTNAGVSEAPIHETLSRQLAHFDCILDHFSGHTEVERAMVPPYRHNAEIKLARKRLVEPHLCFAKMPALLQGGKIKKS